MSITIPDLPQPSKFDHCQTCCPWCFELTTGWDMEQGNEHDADCCGKPVRWDWKNNLIHAMRSTQDIEYAKSKGIIL